MVSKNAIRVLCQPTLIAARASDVDEQSLVPQWPPEPTQLLADDATYEFREVPATSFAMVTDSTIKVGGIIEHSSTYSLEVTRLSLSTSCSEG